MSQQSAFLAAGGLANALPSQISQPCHCYSTAFADISPFPAYLEVIECFQQALAIVREIGFRVWEGRVLGSIGRLLPSFQST